MAQHCQKYALFKKKKASIKSCPAVNLVQKIPSFTGFSAVLDKIDF